MSDIFLQLRIMICHLLIAGKKYYLPGQDLQLLSYPYTLSITIEIVLYIIEYNHICIYLY